MFLLPPPPPTNAAASSSPPTSSEDRISKLPDDVQRHIVSRLPLKDGGVTATLSSTWRRIWSSTPLVLDDYQLRPAGADEGSYVTKEAAKRSRDKVGEKVSAILGSHQGPFRLVRLTSSPASSLRAWLKILATKGVEELVVFNREGPIRAKIRLSVELLRCRSMKRLDLTFCKMPRLTMPGKQQRRRRRRVVHFPNLQQLSLYFTILPGSDIGHFLAGCPALEMLAFIAGYGDWQQINIDVLCPKLKCFVLWMFEPLRVTVDAPRLERLILWQTNMFFLPPQTRIIIRGAPNLRVVGYLDPLIHVLEIGDIVIKAGTMPSPAAMLPSVEIVAIMIRFGVPEDEMTLLSFLRVFPNITTLHIKSALAPPLPENEHGHGFWNNGIFSSITCIPKIKKLAFDEFHGVASHSELSFIKSIAQTCNSLEQMIITTRASSAESHSWLKTQLTNTMSQVEWASTEATLNIKALNLRECREWGYESASDLSLSDPFEYKPRAVHS